MKKVILCMAILIASLATVNSQMSFNTQFGYSSEKVPIAGINFQVKVGHLLIASGLDHHISSSIYAGDLFWAKIGGSINLSELNTIEATAGAGSYYHSSTTKELNDEVGVLSAYFVHQTEARPNTSLFAGITTTSKFSFVSAGLRFTFGRAARGCPSTWSR